MTFTHIQTNSQNGEWRHHLSFVALHPKRKPRPTLTLLDHHRRWINVVKFCAPSAFTREIDRLTSTFRLHHKYKSSSYWALYSYKFGVIWIVVRKMGFCLSKSTARGGAWGKIWKHGFWILRHSQCLELITKVRLLQFDRIIQLFDFWYIYIAVWFP